MRLLIAVTLLLGAETSGLDPALGAEVIGYVEVKGVDRTSFCDNPQQLRAVELLCARKPGIKTTHWRPKAKVKDASSTVRFDLLSLASVDDALAVRRELEKLVDLPLVDMAGNSKLTLSWCPRNYLWSGSSIAVISAPCGAQRLACALTRIITHSPTLPTNSGSFGILGFEGGTSALVTGTEVISRCR